MKDNFEKIREGKKPKSALFDGLVKDWGKGKRKAKAPCPRCGSWNTDVENSIFFCADCGFEG